MNSKRLTIAIVLLVILVATEQTSYSCGSCMDFRNPFLPSHPESVEIAVATRESLENGTLNAHVFVAEEIAGSSRRPMRLDNYPASLLVKNWVSERNVMTHKPLCVHFLFVDTKETCALTLRGNLALFASQPTWYSDTRVVTTRVAFHAIATGELTIAEAVRLGIVVMEGDQSVVDSVVWCPVKGR